MSERLFVVVDHRLALVVENYQRLLTLLCHLVHFFKFRSQSVLNQLKHLGILTFHLQLKVVEVLELFIHRSQVFFQVFLNERQESLYLLVYVLQFHDCFKKFMLFAFGILELDLRSPELNLIDLGSLNGLLDCTPRAEVPFVFAVLSFY